MDLLLAICQALGIGVAVGMLAGAAGREGASTVAVLGLALLIGAGAGGFSATTDDESFLVGAVAGAVAALATARVVAGVVAGASRRGGGGGATAFMISITALVVAAASILVPFLAIAALLGLGYLAGARRRKAQRKHEGLRVLR